MLANIIKRVDFTLLVLVVVQVRLPRLEHTCTKLFPSCIGNQCLLRIDVVYPRGKPYSLTQQECIWSQS